MSAYNVSLTLPISGCQTARLLSEDALYNYLSTSFPGLSSPLVLIPSARVAPQGITTHLCPVRGLAVDPATYA